VDAGGSYDEVLYVDSVTGNTFNLLAPTTFPHLATETISLLADVLVFDAMNQAHTGDLSGLTGHLVEPLVGELNLADVADFGSSGVALLNFGNSSNKVQPALTGTPAANQITFVSTSVFPIADPLKPYQILVGVGLSTEEWALVTNNNTGTNTLTLSANLLNAHSAGEKVSYTPGNFTAYTYDDVDGSPTNTLVSTIPVTLPYGYDKGTVVTMSSGYGIPATNGDGFAFYLPPNIGEQLQVIFDLVRAAGVEIEFLTSR
jgi:hypothetical protein